MRLIIALVVLIIVVVVWRFSEYPSHSQIAAGGVQRKWNMVGDYPNAIGAAERLAKVHSLLIEFMRKLKKKYHIDETEEEIASEGDSHRHAVNAPNDIYNMVDYLLNNYNPDAFYENDPRYSKDTSYTLSKGSSMYICIRDKTDPNKLVDEDTLLFVMLHEAAHIANYKGWGHDNHYWSVFKWLLHEAVEAGIYHPVNYDKNPVMYCGLRIYYQPLYDKNLPNLWESGM